MKLNNLLRSENNAADWIAGNCIRVREGSDVRRDMLLLIVAVVITAGCTSPGGFGGPTTGGMLAQRMPPSQNQMVAASPTGMVPSATLSPTQRLTAALKNNPIARMFSPGAAAATGVKNATASSPSVSNQLDPISLGYQDGPPNPQLYVSMAEVSERTGNDNQARLMYQKAIVVDPENLPALLGLARLEDRLGRLDVAKQFYRQAATAHPQDPSVLNDLALCHARNGNLQISLALLEQVVQLQPQRPLYRNNIAKVLTELNRNNEALAHLSAVHPPAIANYNLGFLLNQRGRQIEAAEYLRTASRIDPQMQPAQALLAQLGQQPTQIAQRPKVDDGILPTPYSPMPSYPATGVPAVVTLPHAQSQELPVTTSQLPVASAPLLLPPVQ